MNQAGFYLFGCYRGNRDVFTDLVHLKDLDFNLCNVMFGLYICKPLIWVIKEMVSHRVSLINFIFE